MEFLDELTEGLDRVLMVRGGGREVITIYSWFSSYESLEKKKMKKSVLLLRFIGKTEEISFIEIHWKNLDIPALVYTFLENGSSRSFLSV